MPRLSQIDADREQFEVLCQLLAEGVPHRVIGETMGVTRDTVGDWKKRPDVQSRVTVIIKERANAILAHTDTSIQKKLEAAAQEGAKPIPVEVLLQIRRTYAGEKVVLDTAGDKAGAMEELMKVLHENPEIAAAFAESAGAPDTD